MTRPTRAVLFLALAAAGCGPKDANNDGIADGVKDPNSVTLVAPSTPVGSISGQVLNSRLSPLADADVNVTLGNPTAGKGGPFKASTDTDGNFAIAGVPAGAQLQVTISKSGYATVRTAAVIPSSAGNFPINDGNATVGPFTLTQTSGTVSFHVITHTGKPARGVKATIEASPAATLLSPASGTYGDGFGIVVADGTVDDQGTLTFGGVPPVEELSRLGGNYDVTVQAFDDNGDGTPDFQGWFQRYSARSLITDPTVRLITLPDARPSLALFIVASNVDSMVNQGSSTPAKNLVKPGETLYFVFNQPVPETSLVIRLSDEYGVQNLVVTKAMKIANTLTVNPAAPFDAGKEYNLSIRATSLDNSSTFSRAAYVFCGDPATPKPFSVLSIQYKDNPPANQVLNAGELVVATFNQPIAVVGSPAADGFVNYDINNTSTIGDVQGETGFATGFSIFPAEPVNEKDTLFVLLPSGYTSRYEFVFSGATVGVPNNTTVSIAFGKLMNASGGYQTLWGVPIASDASSPVTFSPP